MARIQGLEVLRRRSDFISAQQQGSKTRGRFMTLKLRSNHGAGSRLGFTISKKVGNAVVRNRVRRRLRELARTHREEFKADTDHVFICFKEAADAPFEMLNKEFQWLLQHAH